MRRLLTLPLSYLVIAETLVVAALGFAGWRLLERIRTPSPASAVVAATPAAAGPRASSTTTPQPAAPPRVTAPPRATAAPPGPALPAVGSATDPAYWAGRLGRLNSDQADLQKLQWQVIQAVKSAAERYLREVVLTAVTAAQRSHPIATPSPRAPPQ